ncbi:MAG: Transcriptional regulatory protein PmpR [Candidatus Anoxychlamydiales bacterium]|nr:Transcriptional regulatory protein PmpR [Candidatus Anoxychlamydiales bacterium]NGX36218.1 Transcriptional regulatory protein PmpR [Candidatus Anoxychlamydiales bacterium]
MAGHSKWANIKHRKERADKKKGKLFSRIAKEIITAVKEGGADPQANAKLKIVIQKAKDANLPNDVIDRNIKKATSKDQKDYLEMSYELYGYGGVGLIVDIMSDNKNRISSEIRIAINKCGGNIATPGAVSFNFKRKGILKIDKKLIKEDELFMKATDLGAEDFLVEDDTYTIISQVEDIHKIKEGISLKGEAALESLPNALIECSDEDIDSNIKLIEFLENLDDVDAVYHNMKI